MVKQLELQPTYWEMIEHRAAVSPDRVFVGDDYGRSLTVAEFRDSAERVAAGLIETGIQPGQTVSWQLPTTVDACLVMAALARLTCVQNPIIHILRHSEVGFIVSELRSDWIITPEIWRNFDYGSMARDIADNASKPLEVLTVPDGLPEGDPSALPRFADLWAALPEGQANWIYYSSGTTGRPKGARHTDSSVLASSNAIVSGVGLNENDVFPCAFPLTHIGGISFLVGALRTGARMVTFDSFDPMETPKAMAAHGATIVGSAVPFFQAYLAVQATQPDTPLFPDLRVCAAGGAPTPPEMHFELKEQLGHGIQNGWGLTEFPNASFTRVGDPDDWHAHTVGPAADHVTIRVVGTDGVDHTTDGQIGELRVDGPQKLSGYIDAELDADAFDELGFFRSGDLGLIDENGNVRITGRIKDIIIRKAENISAVEVENALYSHQAIADVAVIGVPDPDAGERVCAVVVLAEGHESLAIPSIAEHCRAQGLANQKIPEQLEIVTALPRNPAGKILKHELKAELIGD
jgi:acyl-CoA synthetase (AMP-forming)/AMP-acid ligase II